MKENKEKIIKEYDLSKSLQEFDIWEKDFAPFFAGVPQNISNICSFGFTEIVNNAIDHSEGKRLAILLEKTKEDIFINIWDDGIGIFDKIKNVFHLPDIRLALLELAKGKLTTDPQHHTGEDIFFTSHAFDEFVIISKHLSFKSELDGEELYNYVLKENMFDDDIGTMVGMSISLNRKRKLVDVFNKFALPSEDDGFNKTIVPVRLAKYTEYNLISRSQAKRLLARLENFKEVTFDFEVIDFIGPAFADEVFRVFAHAYPDVIIKFINANPEVEARIKAVQKKGK